MKTPSKTRLQVDTALREDGGVSAASTSYPREATIHGLFEKQAGRTPEAVALLDRDRPWSYAELNRRANLIARRLEEMGVFIGAPVALCFDRSPAMIAAMLGILKAGGAYVPLDPGYPSERLSWMLEDIEASVVLTEPGSRDSLPATNAKILTLDDGWAEPSRIFSENPSRAIGPEDLAYVMYTSGSTGRPKGVRIPHRGVVRLVRATDYARFGPEEVFLQFAPISFDASTFEIWGALLNGARLAIVPPGPTSLEELAAALKRHDVTTLWLTAGLFHQMVDTQMEGLRGVRQLLAGGDVLSVPHVKKVLRAFPECRLINGYGPTENTTFTCCHTVRHDSSLRGSVPIGRPIANTRVYLLDEQLRPCPPGSVGELYIAGDGLALGYWRRPELTEQKFILSPFPAIERGRLYRSGDLGRYLPEGDIEFLGRADRQVKIRGHRIEPEEIETVIALDPRIRQSVVVAVEGAGADKHLVAYVVANEHLRTSEPWDEEPAAQGEAGEGVPAEPSAVLRRKLVPEVRRFLQSRLPEYMVPSSFVVLDSLPLDRNGKIDRRSLPAPSNEREVETPFLPPRTPVEEMLCKMWKELLGLDVVGIDDNFFELGGHSLIANQLMSRIWAGFGIEIPLSWFFRSPTVREIADRLSGAETVQSVNAVSIRRVERSGDLPLSPSQENVWFLQQLDPDNRAYQFQPTLRFHGELDEVALEQSLAEVLRRHEIWRTTFPSVEGAPVQRIHASLATPLTVVDLQEVAESARDGELRRRIDEEVQRTFDLTKLPLVRWTLYRLGPQEHVLQHVEHHIVHDGWSFNVFLRELATLYKAFHERSPSPLPEPEIQFGDYAIFQRRWMEIGQARAQRTYWMNRLIDPPAALEIPSDRPRPAAQTFRGAVRVVEIPVDLAEALRALSRREGCTLFMTMLASFAALLYRYSGREDFCIGSGVANRRRLETEGLMGMFVNMVALRMDLGGEPTFTELLRRIRDVTLEGYENQDYPFAAVVDAVQPERTLSHSPLCQVLFSFHDAPLADLDFGGLQLDLQEFVSNGSAKFDLNIICVPRSEQRIGRKSKAPASGITLAWEYNTDLFDESTIGRMLGHFETLLRAVVSNADRPVSLLPMLPPAEKHQILAGFSGPERRSSRTETVTELFEEQARRTPDAVAVVFGRERVSYAQLNERANRLAWHLRKRGVGPEALVGLCVERSVQMVVGLLGILKAGGAYVPLDPEYPRLRLEFMLEDTAARVVLTQQSLLERLPKGSFERVRLDADWGEIEKESAENPGSHATSENLAYVIYTSGSTGTPKGVAIEHHSTVALLAWAKETFNAGELAGVLASTSICFDLSVFEIFAPLSWGGTVILSEDVLHFPELPAAQEVTLVNTIPSAMAQLIRMGALPASVGTVNLAGEPLAPSLVREILLSRTVRRVFDLYGPTEDTTYSTCARRTAEGPATIGRPISNKRVYVLDAHLQPVPVGIPGDLYVAGAGVARGYLNRPELTRERFLADPFAVEPGSRVYKTGDLARLLPDGDIEFLGRSDQQVKIRGFRIELGEIETALREHPGVHDAVVASWSDGDAEKRLFAYFVPESEDAPPAGTLRRHLAEKLPDYMIPSGFISLETIPRTPNGKVDRAALPPPDGRRPEVAPFVPPRTKVERALADVWKEVLKVDRVGVEDNFFELGGHSLLATVLVNRIAQSFSVRIPLRRVFEKPTLESFAFTIAEDLAGEKRPEVIFEILEEVRNLSDEDARLQLAAEGNTDKDGSPTRS